MGLTIYSSGTYATAEGSARASWYGFSGTPAVNFDGIDLVVGGQASGSMYESYRSHVAIRLGTASPLNMNANYTMVGDEVTVSVLIDVDLAVTTSSNKVQFLICQDGLHAQTNMLVDMLPEQAFTLTNPGQSTLVNSTFTMAPGWTEEDMNIIVLVQSDATREILQSTKAVADYHGTMVVDCVPDGVEAGWTVEGPEDLIIHGQGDKTLNLFFTGSYTLTWDDIPYWTTPANNPNNQTVAEDGLITFTGEYSNGPFEAITTGPLANSDSGQGVSLVDFNGDGHLDIHIVNDGSADQLMQNMGDGNFVEVIDPLINDTGAGRSSAWADYNNDGNLDVYLGKYNEANVLLLGDGAGAFTVANSYGTGDTGPTLSVSWIDYDLDGILDLYSVNDGSANQLLHGAGDVGGGFYIFSTITSAASDVGPSSAAAWGDADGDGRVDLYITNKFSSNTMLANLSLGFSDETSLSGLGEGTNGMGAAWGDYDNDGDMDLYLANDGMADKLYRNDGGFSFSLINGENLGDMGHGRGVHWVDFDNDGYLDIFVSRYNETDLLLLGNDTGTFSRVPVGPGFAPANAASCGDVNGDGFVDVVVSRDGAANQLLLNGLVNVSGNNWAQIKLTGVQDNKTAIGTRVELTANGMTQTRLITAGSGYLSMNSLSADFGLGLATTYDLEIFWPNGTVQSITGMTVNHILNVVQGEDQTTPANDAIPMVTALFGAAPNPFNPATTIVFSLAADSEARVDVYTIDGRFVKTLVNGPMAAGEHGAVWNGKDSAGRSMASGTYFYQLSTQSGFTASGRMALVK